MSEISKFLEASSGLSASGEVLPADERYFRAIAIAAVPTPLIALLREICERLESDA